MLRVNILNQIHESFKDKVWSTFYEVKSIKKEGFNWLIVGYVIVFNINEFFVVVLLKESVVWSYITSSFYY